MDTNRLILRAWIDAILHHALVRFDESHREQFVRYELDKLELDFRMQLDFDPETWRVEIIEPKPCAACSGCSH